MQYRHGRLDGCALLSPDQIEKLKASMAANWRSDPRPFESYQLTNNNAEIRRVKTRIEQLSKQAQRESSQLQKKPSILQTMREQGEKVQTEPEKKAPSGRDAER